jgi:predicted PurR-regulated permease PerM
MRNDPSHLAVSTSAGTGESLSGNAASRRLTISISQRTLWLAAGVALVALVVILALAHAFGALLLIFFAITLAESVRPLVMRMEHRRIPRPLGALLIYLVIAVLLILIGWLLFRPLATQINEFITNAPAYVTQVRQWAKDTREALAANEPLSALVDGLAAHLATSLLAALPALLRFPVSLLSGAFGALINIVIVVTMSVFWLLSADKLRDFTLNFTPERARAAGASLFTELGHTLGGWVRGTLVAMLLIGSLTALGLWLLGVPYALLLGILAGLTEVIPYLGPWISGTVAVIVTLLALDPVKALEVAVLFVIIQEVESNLIEPFVMSWAVHIDPLLVLIAITIGFEVLGVVGAIIAVPVAGLAQVLTQRVVAPAIRRTTTENIDSSLAPTDASSVHVPGE